MNRSLRITLGAALALTIVCFAFGLMAPAFSSTVEITKPTIINTIAELAPNGASGGGKKSNSLMNSFLARTTKGLTETLPDDFTIPIYNGNFSIFSGIAELFQGNWKDFAIASIIILFSILFPLLKFQIYFNILFENSYKKYEKAILWFSKFSMMDVFVLSLMLMLIKDIPQTKISFFWGFYIYSASVILNIVLGCVIESFYGNKNNSTSRQL